MLNLISHLKTGSIDATVVQISQKTNLHVISNVSSTSFGSHDFDERIVQYILAQRTQRIKRLPKSVPKPRFDEFEVARAYRDLMANIKTEISIENAVHVDLNIVSGVEEAKENELYIDKNLIVDKICRDLYDWASAHIEKALNQADVADKNIDEIILICGNKMPGFKEYLKVAYPDKNIVTDIDEEKLAVGASIFVIFSYKLQ
jgi:molecular chaperone DnaK (HSP70)